MITDPKLKKRKVIAIFGITGSGKTTLAKKILPRFPRQIIIDPNEEYEGTLRVRTIGELEEFFEFVGADENYRIVCTFENDAHADQVFDLAWYVGNVLVVVDEAASYMEQPSPELLRLVRRGRHQAVSLLFLSPRVPDIHPDVRSMARTKVMFYSNEEADRKRAMGMGMADPITLKIYPDDHSDFFFVGENLWDAGDEGLGRVIHAGLPCRSFRVPDRY